MKSIDRGRGILSKADRRYLTSPDDYTDQGAYERRKAIRERLQNALYDFELLADPDTFSSEEVERIARREAPLVGDDDREKWEIPEPVVRDMLVEAAAFIYRMSWSDDEYQAITASGRSTARRRRSDLDRYGTHIRAKWRAGEPWSDDELKFAIHNPDVVGLDAEEIVEHARSTTPKKQFEEWVSAETGEDSPDTEAESDGDDTAPEE